MARKMFLIIAGLALLSGLAFADVQINTPAPNFTLKAADGREYSLSDFQGKFVVLEWTNFDCPFSKKHYSSGNMQSLQNEELKKGVVWLTINSSAEGLQGYFSSEEINERIRQNNASPTAYLIDSDGKVGKRYGAKTTPHMFVINPEGMLIYQGAIDDKPTFDSADTASAKNYVREALQEAMLGQSVSVPETKSYGCSVKY